MTDGFAEANGVRMHYRHAGTGKPLILLHGLVGSCRNWRRNMHALARSSSVYAIDMANMGESERVRGLDATFAATADRLAALMDALGLPEADIVGHSHGGAVALMLAARHPRRVRSLVLFAPANPYCTLGHTLVKFWRTAPGFLLARLAVYLPRTLHRIALNRMWGEPARVAEGTLEGYLDGACVPGTLHHMRAILRGWFADMAELEAALPRVAMASVPTLLVWGDRDRAVSLASAAQLRRQLPNAELAIVETAGHVAFEELPVQCNRLITGWISRGSERQADRSPDAVHVAGSNPPAPVYVMTRPAAADSTQRPAGAIGA